MFGKEEYVFYGSEGVCVIDDIVSSPFDDVKTDEEYYVLHSLHGSGSKLFIPVARAEALMRRLMSRAEIDSLIGSIDNLPLFSENSLKALKDRYGEAMRTGKPAEWVRVIKTVYDRVRNGRGNGRKVSDAEKAFSEDAKRYLYMEVSTVLGIPVESVSEYIQNRMTKDAG